MKKIKKSCTMLLILLLLLVVGYVMPQTVKAAESDFVINENGVLTKYVGAGGDVVIPEGVTSIGDSAFGGCSALTSISIPEGVTSIGNSAFSGCSKLKSIYIYNKDATIGTGLESSITSPIFGNDNTFITLHGYKDSTTELCAKEWGYKFEPLPDGTTNPLIEIFLQKTQITIDVGKTSLNSVIYNPDNTTDDKTVKWSSSNPEIAIVYSNGKVKGVASGSAIITAAVGDKTATCTVTVR